MINTSKRDLQMLRYFAVGMILSHPIFMIINYLNTIGYHIASINISSLNKFTAFGLIATYVGVYFNKPTIPSYIKEKINKKIKILYFFNILIIAYPIVSYKLFHIKSVFISFLIMEAHYIGIILLTRVILSIRLQDYQLKWRKAMSGYEEDDESNFSWRLKLWFLPHEYIEFKYRFPNLINRFLTTFIVLIVIFNKPNIITILFLLPIFKNLLIFIEGLLGLQTSLKGICTGYTYKSPSDERPFYDVYVTDYENQREIHFKSYKHLYISENQEVRVIHGIFSKIVLSVNNIKIL